MLRLFFIYFLCRTQVNLTEYGNLTNGNGVLIGDAVAAEEQKIANDNKYEWMPVAKLGVSYHF